MSERGPRLALPVLLAVIAAASLAAADGNEAHAETVVQVPLDSGIVPGGLAVGDEFRLLFTPGVGHSFTDDKIRNMAAGSAKPIQEFNQYFRVLHFGHSDRDDVRSHTYTEGAGVPVYWLGGSKIADTYDAFYAGGTPGRSGESRNEHGQYLQSARYSYGVSPIFEVVAAGADARVIPTVTMTPARDLVQEEGDQVRVTFHLSDPAHARFSLNVHVATPDNLVRAFDQADVVNHVRIDAGTQELSNALVYYTVDDSVHEPGGDITYTLRPSGDGSYMVGEPSVVTFTIEDDDPDPNLPPPACTRDNPCVTLDASGSYFEGRKVAIAIHVDPSHISSAALPVKFATRDSGHILDAGNNAEHAVGVHGRTDYFLFDTVRDCDHSGQNWIDFKLLPNGNNYQIREGEGDWKRMTLTERWPHPEGPRIYLDRPTSPNELAIREAAGANIPIGGLFKSEYLACSNLAINYNVAQTNNYLLGTSVGNFTADIATGQGANPTASIPLRGVTAGNQGGGTVTVTLLPGTGYRIGSPSGVTYQIDDSSGGTLIPFTSFAEVPPPEVSIGLSAGGSEGDPVDFGINVTPAPLRAPLPVNVTLSGTGNVLNASDAGWRIVTIPASGLYTLSVNTLNDTVVDSNTITLTINPGDDYTLGLFSTQTVDIQDNGVAPQEQQTPPPEELESSQAQELTAVAVDPGLIANITAMAGQTHHGQEHVDRWTRALAALGEADHGNPMTAVEAKENAKIYSSPLWPQIAAVLALLEEAAAQQQQQDPPQTPPEPPTQPAVDPALLAGVREQASQTHHGAEHVDRWMRVLAAFGEANHDNPMTASEARANAQIYSSPLWPQIADALAARE